MSGVDKLHIATSNKSIFLIVLSVVLLGALFLVLPLYLQNRLNSLYTQSYALADKVTFLQRDAMLLELKINQLSSLENLSSFAQEVGLGYYGIPKKIMIRGGAE